MQQYSLKDVFFNKNSLINEMAIITQSNFIERIVNAVKKKPQIAGVTNAELEALKQKSPNSDLNKLEDSIAKEILRCVYKTNLLDLTGKENKKARKQAEVLVIKQLRKYNNFDMEPIDFKKCLPLYDKLADFVEDSADVDLSDCIKIADFYMKSIYPNATAEEKKEIDAGEFSFSTISTRTGYYKKYLRDYHRRVGNNDIYLVHESDDWKVVFPGTPKSFRQFAIKNSKSENPSVSDLSWCTLKDGTWFTYMQTQLLFIAIYKKSKPGDRLSLVSLKVNFDGSINIEDSCCRENHHLDSTTLGNYLTPQVVQDVKNAAEQLGELGFGEGDAENSMEEMYDNLTRRLKEITQVRSVPAIKNIMTRFCLPFKRATFDACKILVDNNQGFTDNELSDLLVEFLSEIFFNNWLEGEAPEPGCKIPGRQMILDPSKLGLKLIDKFKEKILNPRSHPQYLITMLSIDFESISNFSDEEIKGAIKIALETNNEYNFKRALSLILRSEHFKNLIELDKINNQEEISSPIAKEIIEIILNSKGNVNFTSSRKYKLFSNLNREISLPLEETVFMLGNFYVKRPERFVEITNESDAGAKIKKNLFNGSIMKTFRPNATGDREAGLGVARLPGIDVEEWRYFVDNVFSDFDLFNKYFNLYEKQTLQKMCVFASQEMTPTYRRNLVNLKNQEFPMIFEKIVESVKDNNSTLQWVYDINTSAYKKYITNRVLDNLATNFVNNLDAYAERIFARNYADKTDILLFEVAKKIDTDSMNKAFYYIIKKINKITNKNESLQLMRKSFIRHSRNDRQLKDFISYIFNKSDNFDFKFDSANLIQKVIRDKTIKDDIGEETLSICLDSNSYYKTKVAIQSLSKERITSENVVQMLVQYVNNLTKTNINSIDEICNNIFDYLISVFNERNIPFPKEALSKIILLRKAGFKQTSGQDIDSIIENFISLPREVSGKDLGVIRDTLVKIFRKNLSKNFYNNPKMKSFIINKIKEMPRVARGHMQLAFPEMASQLRARTPEEEAEQAARNETLLRQYVRMLMS